MTQNEIDTMWQQAMRESIKDGAIYIRHHFDKVVASAEREACEKTCNDMADKMTDMAAWGAQECLKSIRARGWIGLEGAEAGWFCYTDFLNARKYTKKQRQLICCQLLSEAQSWDIGNYQLMMHDSTKIKENT